MSMSFVAMNRLKAVRRGSRRCSAAMSACLALMLSLPSLALAQSIVQTFFVPLPDDQVRTALYRLRTGTGQTMDSVISIVVTGSPNPSARVGWRR